MRCLPRFSVTVDAMIVPSVAPHPATGNCVAEKGPLTNRVRRHFARIKAAGTEPARGLRDRKTNPPQSLPDRSGWFLRSGEEAMARTGRRGRHRRRSGHVGAVGWGNHATHHAFSGLG